MKYFLFFILWLGFCNISLADNNNPGGDMKGPPIPFTISINPNTFLICNPVSITQTCIPDNSAVGTVIATASVQMIPASGTFNGYLRLINVVGLPASAFAISGLNIVTNQLFTSNNDGNVISMDVIAIPNQ